MAICAVAPLAGARFPLGNIVMTRGVNALIHQGALRIGAILPRHMAGDWGDLDPSDIAQNNAALASGDGRLFSSYQIRDDLKVWIITEHDRSVTTLLLPDEY